MYVKKRCRFVKNDAGFPKNDANPNIYEQPRFLDACISVGMVGGSAWRVSIWFSTPFVPLPSLEPSQLHSWLHWKLFTEARDRVFLFLHLICRSGVDLRGFQGTMENPLSSTGGSRNPLGFGTLWHPLVSSMRQYIFFEGYNVYTIRILVIFYWQNKDDTSWMIFLNNKDEIKNKFLEKWRKLITLEKIGVFFRLFYSFFNFFNCA